MNHKAAGDFNTTESKEMSRANAYIQEDEMTEMKGNVEEHFRRKATYLTKSLQPFKPTNRLQLSAFTAQ